MTDYTAEELAQMTTEEVKRIAADLGITETYLTRTRKAKTEAILRRQSWERFDDARRRAVKNAR